MSPDRASSPISMYRWVWAPVGALLGGLGAVAARVNATAAACVLVGLAFLALALAALRLRRDLFFRDVR